MSFHFPLQAILHFRQSVERQQELRLRAANQLVARARQGIERVDERRQSMHAERSRDLEAGVTAAELRFGLKCEAELVGQRREIELQLVHLEQLRDQQREIFQQARRVRETLENLREQLFSLYKQAALRREQRNLDDLFLLRRRYLRRG